MARACLLVSLIFVCLAGCSQPANRSSFRMPWERTLATMPGVKTPVEKIEDLKLLASNGPKATQAERERVSDDLSLQIQQEKDPLVRLYIVRALAAYPSPRSSAVLHAALEDPDTKIRIAACQAWGERGGPEAVEELSVVLTTEADIDVRMAAAGALGKTKNHDATKALAGVLVDNDPAMQRRALESLRAVSGKDYGADVTAWQQYAAGQPVAPQPQSLADRWRKLF